MTAKLATADVPIVYVVDDDEAVRYALGRLFDSVGLKAETFASGAAFLEAFSDDHLGCVVVDMRMPGMSGMDVQHHLNDRSAMMPLIVITGHGEVETGVLAMKNGAFDFIEKPFGNQKLIDTVQSAIQRHADYKQANSDRMLAAKMYASLTKREREILAGVLEGMPSKRIAANLNVTEKTIEYHRANIMKKMEARSLADLIKKAMLLEAP